LTLEWVYLYPHINILFQYGWDLCMESYQTKHSTNHKLFLLFKVHLAFGFLIWIISEYISSLLLLLHSELQILSLFQWINGPMFSLSLIETLIALKLKFMISNADSKVKWANLLHYQTNHLIESLLFSITIKVT